VSLVPDLKINVLTNPDRVSEFWAWLTKPGRSYVACDTETTGLDWPSASFRVRLIQFGDTGGGWAIPFEGWPSLVREALAWCSKARVKLIFHNSGYDAMALRKLGIDIDWSIVEDTFVWAGITGYAEQARTLKGCAQREFGGWAGQGERILKGGMSNAGWTWADVPIGWKPYPLYGVVDTCITAGLWERWAAKRKGKENDHALEIAAIRLTNDMSWRGLPTDGTYLSEQIDAHTVQIEDLKAQLATFGVTNPAQNAQLEKVLKADGVKLGELTANGSAKLDKDVLKAIDHPVARLVEQYRWTYRVRGTYLQPLFQGGGGALGRGGRVHPGIKSMEAKTGRMAIENPPMQQLPANDPVVRRGIVARSEDEVVISSDYGQIELRMWGSLNDDQPLLDTIRLADATGGDFFVEVGKRVYGEPDFVKKDKRRTLLKSTIYAKLFGGGMDVAAATAGVPFYSMTSTWKMLEETFPSLKNPGMSLIHTAKNSEGHLEHSATSPYGRRFQVLDQQERRKVPNYVTQGTAAIALKKALVALDAAGFGEAMMLPVHDEVVFSVPRAEAADAMVEIAEAMDSVFEGRFDIPIHAEPSMGENWAEAKG